MTIRACPVCERPAVEAFRPFCSARCKDEDLRRWLAAEYRIPSRPGQEAEDESPGLADENR
jgi:endogenous inhibitor of DNA gyrase (YacG/DUF329 family)